MTNPKPPADQGDDVQDNIYDAFNEVRLKALAFRDDRDALQAKLYAANKQIVDLQAKLDEANLLALSLQGQIVTMMAQPTEMWLIKYTDPENGLERRHVFLHNAIEDYKKLYGNATVTELIPRVAPV